MTRSLYAWSISGSGLVALEGALLGPIDDRGRRMDGAGMPDTAPPGDPFIERPPGVESVGRRDIEEEECCGYAERDEEKKCNVGMACNVGGDCD